MKSNEIFILFTMKKRINFVTRQSVEKFISTWAWQLTQVTSRFYLFNKHVYGFLTFLKKETDA